MNPALDPSPTLPGPDTGHLEAGGTQAMSSSALSSPTRDLDSPEEITEMVRRFYRDVAQDDLLGPLFNDVAGVDWSEHLPKLTAFWCRALLGIEGYVGNPYRAHSLVNDQAPLTLAHFERWLELFHDVVEVGWAGPKVQRALALAHNVARVHARQFVRDSDESSEDDPRTLLLQVGDLS